MANILASVIAKSKWLDTIDRAWEWLYLVKSTWLGPKPTEVWIFGPSRSAWANRSAYMQL